MINDGTLLSGDRLPTAKELYSQYKIARGTVKKAYSQLSKNGLVTVTQGKSAFIHDQNHTGSIEIINQCIEALSELSFTLDEIEIFVAQELQKRGEMKRSMRIAVVDSCSELMFDITESIRLFPDLELIPLHLESAQQAPYEFFKKYDFTVAVLDVFNQLSELRNNIESEDVLVPLSIGLSSNTLKSLSSIKQSSYIGLYCNSKRYSSIIRSDFSTIDNSLIPQSIILSTSGSTNLKQFLASKDVLFTTRNYHEYSDDLQIETIEAFRRNGGKVIELEYTIDQGSSLYMDELIRKYRISHYDILL